MVVYAFYIFDRHSDCIYRKRWNRPASASAGAPSRSMPPEPATTATGAGSIAPDPYVDFSPSPHTEKLIFGAVFSLRNIATQLGGVSNDFLSYSTLEYRLHYFETPSRIKFVLITDPRAGPSAAAGGSDGRHSSGLLNSASAAAAAASTNLRNVLHHIWANLYIEYVVKNPLSPVEHPDGIGITNELFDSRLEAYLEKAVKA